jgi:hypothetical protein
MIFVPISFPSAIRVKALRMGGIGSSVEHGGHGNDGTGRYNYCLLSILLDFTAFMVHSDSGHISSVLIVVVVPNRTAVLVVTVAVNIPIVWARSYGSCRWRS